MVNYTVEKILESKLIKGRMHYKIKWKGYPVSQCTWEPLQHLSTCKEMVKEFERQSKGEAKPVKKQQPKQTAVKKPAPRKGLRSEPDEGDIEPASDGEDANESQEEEKGQAEEVYEESPMDEITEPPRQTRSKPAPARQIQTKDRTKPVQKNEERVCEEEEEVQYGMKMGEGKAKGRILGLFKDGEGGIWYRMPGKTEPVPRSQLIENDPMSLILFYEKNLKVFSPNQ